MTTYKTVFDKIILVGAGQVTTQCLKFLCDECQLGDICFQIAYKPHPLYMGKYIVGKYSVAYLEMHDYTEMTSFLNKISERTLIISCDNLYLFHEDTINKDNFKIVNCHGGLLPDYPGNNIPTWIIYNEEKETGCTWHNVEPTIDSGEIYSQSSFSINEHTTALQILQENSAPALHAFKDFLYPLLLNELKGVTQNISKDRKVYKSKEIPDEGIITIEASPAYSYKVLRSMDYGRLSLMQAPVIFLSGQCYSITNYQYMTTNQEMKPSFYHSGNTIHISDKNSVLILTIK